MASIYTRKVFYYETDKMGIVHHANYIRWLEEARVDSLESVGMPFNKIEEQGVLMPVLSISYSYKLPFAFNERFYVKSTIPEFKGSRFTVLYTVYDENGAVHGEGVSTHCFTDMEMKPIRVKNTHPDIYNAFYTLSEEGCSCNM